MSNRNESNTTWLTLMGLLLIVFGVVAIAAPAVAGTAVVYVVGGLLFVAGIVQIVSGVRSEAAWFRKVYPLILGLITACAGLGLLGHPLVGLKFLTLLLIVFFLVEGFWKIIASFSYRPARGWLAMFASGAVTLVLSVLIWQQWPVSGVWAVGVLVGVDLLATGVSLVMLGITLRRVRNLSQAPAA